jgi:hypothetical protein
MKTEMQKNNKGEDMEIVITGDKEGAYNNASNDQYTTVKIHKNWEGKYTLGTSIEVWTETGRCMKSGGSVELTAETIEMIKRFL